MDGVIKLLNDKNHFLKKFYTLNKAELFRLGDGDFSNIERFYESRENILNTVHHIDVLVEDRIGEIRANSQISDETRRALKTALDFKDDLVQKILDQDLKIISLIDGEKSKLLKELNVVRKNRKTISAYKSGKSGGRLDEEA